MMNWLAVYRSERGSLALRQPVLSEQDVVACESAVSLLQHLEARDRAQEEACEAALKAAHARGFAQGRQEAMELVQDQLLKQWLQVGQEARADAARLREAMITLSIQMVRRMAGSLAPDELLTALARQAIAELSLGASAQSSLVLRVHTDWVEALRQCVAAQAATLAACPVEIHGDAACGLMDLVIQTPLGQVLAGLDAQLKRMEQNLKDAAI